MTSVERAEMERRRVVEVADSPFRDGNLAHSVSGPRHAVHPPEIVRSVGGPYVYVRQSFCGLALDEETSPCDGVHIFAASVADRVRDVMVMR
jgi:hypothetical protein